MNGRSGTEDPTPPGTRSEAKPADELDLVALVLAALGATRGEHSSPVGRRVVIGQGKGEGAGRPPDADLRLSVVDPEEVVG